MSLKITQSVKRHEYEIDGSILFYNQLTFLAKKRLLFSHMTNGEISQDDSIDLAFAVMKEMVCDWANVTDDDGQELPFDKDSLEGLPLEAVMKFLDEIIYPSFQEFFNVKDKMVNSQKNNLVEQRNEEIKNSEPM